jgi:DNA repair protein RecN (Recombination protein N)
MRSAHRGGPQRGGLSCAPRSTNSQPIAAGGGRGGSSLAARRTDMMAGGEDRRGPERGVRDPERVCIAPSLNLASLLAAAGAEGRPGAESCSGRRCVRFLAGALDLLEERARRAWRERPSGDGVRSARAGGCGGAPVRAAGGVAEVLGMPVDDLSCRWRERMAGELADLDAGEDKLAALGPTRRQKARGGLRRGRPLALSEKRRKAAAGSGKGGAATELPDLKLERARSSSSRLQSDPRAAWPVGHRPARVPRSDQPGPPPPGPMMKVASGGELSRFSAGAEGVVSPTRDRRRRWSSTRSTRAWAVRWPKRSGCAWRVWRAMCRS